jgi:hypothetical protein
MYHIFKEMSVSVVLTREIMMHGRRPGPDSADNVRVSARQFELYRSIYFFLQETLFIVALMLCMWHS